MSFHALMVLLQFLAVLLACIYFARMIVASPRRAQPLQNQGEQEYWQKMRARALSEPLSERARPRSLDEIVGQDEAVQVLLTALSGPYPQHILLYGPPGVGKTAAARLALAAAKGSLRTPFAAEAPFIELDASLVRFDERGIADPLLGSVHDPIYQGAGALGSSGVPQPKPGAVTRAHGGVLFLDEIGELHPIQLNKLLKVLEDRRVMPESSYYNPNDSQTPAFIHDLFRKGLPADFRLIGATTRRPEELPAALRSRCVEIFFRPLQQSDLIAVAEKAALKLGCYLELEARQTVGRLSQNGRDAVNLVQLAASRALQQGERKLSRQSLEHLAGISLLELMPEEKVVPADRVGRVHILGVSGPATGKVMELHALVRAAKSRGRMIMTGVVDEEELSSGGQTRRRRSQVSDALENVRTVLSAHFGLELRRYDVHLDFPGGLVDGPSAGIAMAAAVYSSLMKREIRGDTALTGALSVLGEVMPVGGVRIKIEAARLGGLKRILIPQGNWQESYAEYEGIEVVPVGTIDEVLRMALKPAAKLASLPRDAAGNAD